MSTHDPRIVKARSHLVMNQSFFGTLALYLILVEDESIGTMATDGKYLIYAPSFLGKTSPQELIGVCAHEVLHCAYQHHTRRGSRDPGLWNQAADYAINRDLLAGGFVLPSDRLHDEAFKGMGAEEIYAVLVKRQKARKPEQGGSGMAGQGQGGNGAAR